MQSSNVNKVYLWQPRVKHWSSIGIQILSNAKQITLKIYREDLNSRAGWSILPLVLIVSIFLFYLFLLTVTKHWEMGTSFFFQLSNANSRIPHTQAPHQLTDSQGCGTRSSRLKAQPIYWHHTLWYWKLKCLHFIYLNTESQSSKMLFRRAVYKQK